MPILKAFLDILNLPVTQAVDEFYHSRTPERVGKFAPAEALVRLDVEPSKPILPEVHYLTVTAQKTVLAYDRVLLKKFYAAAHSTVVMPDGSGEPRAITSFQILSPDLLSLDSNAGTKLVQGPRTLVDAVPVHGNVVGVTIALMSVEASDYSKPLLSTLQKLSDIAGVKYFASASTFAEPLILGIQGLSNAGQGVQIAYAGNLPMRTGVFLIAQIDAVEFSWSSYTFASDFSLLRRGEPVQDCSYMVVTIEVSTERLRSGYRQIPELMATEKLLDEAVRKANVKIFDPNSEERKAVEIALANMQWACLSTADLCNADGARIAEACTARVRGFMDIAKDGLGSADSDRGTRGDNVAHEPGPGFNLDDIKI